MARGRRKQQALKQRGYCQLCWGARGWQPAGHSSVLSVAISSLCLDSRSWFRDQGGAEKISRQTVARALEAKVARSGVNLVYLLCIANSSACALSTRLYDRVMTQTVRDGPARPYACNLPEACDRLTPHSTQRTTAVGMGDYLSLIHI